MSDEMNTNGVTAPIRTAVVTTPEEDSSRVVSVALDLQRHSHFRVAIVGCVVTSSIGTFVPLPGVWPGTDRAVVEYREKEAMQKRSREICEMLAVLPADSRPEFNVLDGTYYQIASALSTAFGLVVVPHRLEFPDVFGRLFRNLDTCLAVLGPAPTLFCAPSLTWQGIAIAQTGDQACWWATQILTHISNRLKIPLHQWFPNGAKGQISDAQSSGRHLSSNAIPELDIAAMPEELQADMCLVVSAAVVNSVFRLQRVRRIVRGWQGSHLVWS